MFSLFNGIFFVDVYTKTLTGQSFLLIKNKIKMYDLESINERLKRIEKLLTTQKTVLNLAEVAELTGLSKSHIYKLSSKGLIPHYKPNGKQNYFNRIEIENWLLRNPVKTNEDIEKEALSYVTLNKKGVAK